MWVDKITKHTSDELIVINDSKTPSGRVHVGSLRGVLIHDVLYREFLAEEKPVIYVYGIDDYDPMDGLPADASPDMRQYMGQPLCNIPAPKGSKATDLANHYISEFLGIFQELGVGAQIYRMRDVYRNGVFNEAIDRILSNAHIVREVYDSISGSKRPDDWYPFQVICEKCGKIGTTQVTDYANGLVRYKCNKDMVSWAEGCGHQGQISPFDGNGKLPWKLEWAAKWHEFLITVEGAGKDHCTKGGSRDVASLVLRRLFGEHPPLNVPYEFFLVGGAKMSSSKGLGASSREMADFLPPEILRYLMVRTDAKRAVNFTTDFNYLVKLFNDFDRILLRLRKGECSKEDEMMFSYSMVNQHDQPYHPVSFQLLTSLLQLPHLDAEAEAVQRVRDEGHEPNEKDLYHLKDRIKAAQYWLANLADEEDKFEIQSDLPEVAANNNAPQNAFLRLLADAIESEVWKENVLQTLIFEVARNLPISQGLAFQAIYRVLLGKERGPKAGALLSYLDKGFVINRLRQVSYSVIDLIVDVGIPLEDYLTILSEKRQAMQDVILTPELYLCISEERAETDAEKYKVGYGVAAVNYMAKGKRHTDRVLVMDLEGYDDLAGQEKCLLEKIEKLVANNFGLMVKDGVGRLIKQNIHIDIDPARLKAKLN